MEKKLFTVPNALWTIVVVLITLLINQTFQCPSQVTQEQVKLLQGQLEECKATRSVAMWRSNQELEKDFTKQTEVLMRVQSKKQKDDIWDAMFTNARQPLVSKDLVTGELICYLPGRITVDSFVVPIKDTVDSPTQAELRLKEFTYRYLDQVKVVRQGDSLYFAMPKGTDVPTDSLEMLINQVTLERAARLNWRRKRG